MSNSNSYYPPQPTTSNFWTGKTYQNNQRHNNNNNGNSNGNGIYTTITNNQPMPYCCTHTTQSSTGCVEGQCPVGALTGGPFVHDQRR